MYDELVKRLRKLSGTDNLSEFDEAADAVEELSKPRWISVEEKLPGYGKPVLLYFNRNNHNSMGVGDCYHDGDTLIWRGCGFIPTHWMPLPSAPTEGNK